MEGGIMVNGEDIAPYLDEFREWMGQRGLWYSSSGLSAVRNYLRFLDECDAWPPEMIEALEKRIKKSLDELLRSE